MSSGGNWSGRSRRSCVGNFMLGSSVAGLGVASQWLATNWRDWTESPWLSYSVLRTPYFVMATRLSRRLLRNWLSKKERKYFKFTMAYHATTFYSRKAKKKPEIGKLENRKNKETKSTCT